jgi:hypothetical protein
VWNPRTRTSRNSERISYIVRWVPSSEPTFAQVVTALKSAAHILSPISTKRPQRWWTSEGALETVTSTHHAYALAERGDLSDSLVEEVRSRPHRRSPFLLNRVGLRGLMRRRSDMYAPTDTCAIEHVPVTWEEVSVKGVEGDVDALE